MKNLINDKNGQANIIILAIFTVIMGFGMLTIGTYIYYAVASNADAGTLVASPGFHATGSFVFNGTNITGELMSAPTVITNVTITNGAAIYNFEFNTSTVGTQACTVANPNCILLNVRNTNTSLGAATNLTAAINANASTAALVTATLSGNNTLIVAKSRSTSGNSIVLNDYASPAAQQFLINTTTLSGGVNDVTGQASQNSLNNYVSVTFPLFGLALMILGFGVIMITLRKSFGSGEAR